MNDTQVKEISAAIRSVGYTIGMLIYFGFMYHACMTFHH